jgi:hypothetical protein
MNGEQADTHQRGPGLPLDPRALRTMVFAGEVLSMSAQNLSEGVDSFSGWIIGGFGAVLALLLGRYRGSAKCPLQPIVTVRFGAS